MPATQVIVFEKTPSLEPLVRQACVSLPARVRTVRSFFDAMAVLSLGSRSILIVDDEVGDEPILDVMSRARAHRHWVVVVTAPSLTRQKLKDIREWGACCIVPFIDRKALLLPLLGRLLDLSQSLQDVSNGLAKLVARRAGIDG